MFIKREGCGHGYLLAFLVKEDIFAHPWPRPGHPTNFDRLENKTDYDFESVSNSWCKPAGNTKAIFFGVVLVITAQVIVRNTVATNKKHPAIKIVVQRK
jgi:hypothetical protein